MPEFINGLRLGELFYEEAARPLLEEHFPSLPYSAAMLGWSSEVLGYDDAESRDHNWGPRFQLFLTQKDYEERGNEITQTLARELPREFRGYSTNFRAIPDDAPNVVLAEPAGAGEPVSHKIDLETVEGWFQHNMGRPPGGELTAADWLTFSEQKLLAFTSGRVFRDDLGLEAVRQRFHYYPEDVWLYLLACEWKYVSEEEAFVGRAGFVGDEVGSTVIAARIVRRLMRLCFLYERRYAPYSKWFGTAFSRLACGPALAPLMRAALNATGWRERERRLADAYEAVARMHNESRLTEPIEAKVSPHGRPYLVIHADRFGLALLRRLEARGFPPTKFWVGSVNQFAASDDALTDARLCRALKVLYE
ncbi:MAG TPA: DUF4037 domain-containing protein [Pyrinomonadaceae bacterium]|nr:DUF4037 domain-containing protein [Pyrinomonadaceae bacterium]